jgi:hypothetical protein
MRAMRSRSVILPSSDVAAWAAKAALPAATANSASAGLPADSIPLVSAVAGLMIRRMPASALERTQYPAM